VPPTASQRAAPTAARAPAWSHIRRSAARTPCQSDSIRAPWASNEIRTRS